MPGWVLFAMVRRAAPLRRAWSGALATLAAVGISAAATQFICPLDDPAHQLVGHVLPVAVLSVLGAFVGHRYLNWLDATDAPQETRATDQTPIEHRLDLHEFMRIAGCAAPRRRSRRGWGSKAMTQA